MSFLEVGVRDLIPLRIFQLESMWAIWTPRKLFMFILVFMKTLTFETFEYHLILDYTETHILANI